MLTLKEFQLMKESVEELEQVLDNEELMNKAEYYDLSEDPDTLDAVVTLYDESGAVLVTANVDDYDTAEAYLEEYFDLEEIDHDDRDPDAAASASRYGHGA